MKLTIKQKRFADEYIISGNATEAARVAGYKQPHVQGAQNLEKLRVKEYIDQRLKELESDKIADQKEVLEYLTNVMRREEKESVVVTIKKKVSGYVPDDKGVLKKRNIETEEAHVVEVPAKLSDANKAAELLGKRYGAWTDNVDINADMTLDIKVDYGVEDTSE